MLSIKKFTVENMRNGCVTDNENPNFAFSLESNRNNVSLKSAVISVEEWSITTTMQTGITYQGAKLNPFKQYTAIVKATDDAGETAEMNITFETGRMDTPWNAQWITDGNYQFKEKKVSPKIMTFQKKIIFSKEIVRAKVYATALGIYDLKVNGEKIGDAYFAPGFTSYKNQIQYQTYDITKQLKKENEFIAVIAGGWAVGAFTYARRNRVFAKRQAFLCEIHVEFKDGTMEIISTDKSWNVTLDGKLKEAEFYCGEVYDATVQEKEIFWHAASVEKIKIKPEIIAEYGLPVRAHEVKTPVDFFQTETGVCIYDFGQNFAGIVSAKIRAKKGTKIVFKHAEVMMDGELFMEPLRTATQEITYICKEGEQHYSPTMTYMGFRYIGVTGIQPEDLEINAMALYSDMEESGSFECSNAMLNKLQNNIIWSAKSNFVDIPTDCPQRDERMGWTGDIALFASTASYNFDMSRFLGKWLLDVKMEQNRGGGIPVTVPLVRVPMQWEIMVPMAVDHWGDACILVPWAEYLTRGDETLLKKMYPTMKRYIKACKFWAGFLSVGKHRRVWKLLHHYGDWVAPEGELWTWMGRGKWTATASLANTSRIVSEIAIILGQKEDANYYKTLSKETSEAYRNILMKKDCTVKNEFQTAYVLPLHYKMLNEEDKMKTAEHLVRMIRENHYHIGTGFPGTPYVLFALADHGYAEDAFKMLLEDSCPSWLFQIKAGATTIWERFDALREDGTCNTGSDDGTNGMVSFNHYASGAVGDFLYKRVLGIEPISGGYKTFKIKPLIGGNLTYAKGKVQSAYGKIFCKWKIAEDLFFIEIEVPVNTTCHLVLPNGEIKVLGSGIYNFKQVYHSSSKQEQ